VLASRIRVVAVGAAEVQLTGASDSRIALTVSPPISGSVTLSNDAGVTSGQGLNLGAGSAPLTLTLAEHGDCVQREWLIIGSGAGLGVGLIETLATCAEDQQRHLGKVLRQRTALYPGER